MCRFHKSWYLKKVVGGRKRICSRAGNTGTGSRCTRTHSTPGRRQNVKAGSGRQLLVPPLLSAWRLLWSWVASRGPARLNSLKMSKHLRGVRAVPGPDNRQPSCPAHKPGWKWLRNLSCKVLWPSVCPQIVFCFHTGVTSTQGLLCPCKPASNRSRPVY